MEITSRYEALGTPLPNPITVCKGPCEGTGVYPQHRDWTEEGIPGVLWSRAHSKAHTLKAAVRELSNNREWWFWKSVIRDIFTGRWFRCDGWHFIVCERCKGIGKEPNALELED